VRTPGRSTVAETAQPAAEACRAVTKASRSNFAYAFLVLPRAQRDALYAIYAFCRLTDDLVDEAVPNAEAPAVRLAAWRAELDACIRGEARHPVLRRLGDVIQHFRIPRAYFEELLNGVEMDLGTPRYASFAELETYCYRVAGVVGLMCIEVFGYRRPETRVYAERLGTAFQLTNILRDVGVDAQRGRIYLPLEDLTRFGCTEDEILGCRLTPAVREVLRFEAARARDCYTAAQAALPAEDRRPMLPAEIMRTIYRRLLERIETAE